MFVLCLSALPATPVAAADPTIASFSLSGSPFDESLAPLADQLTVKLTLTRRARVTVTIRRLDGTVVRYVTYRTRLDAGSHSWSWHGRRSSGAVVRDGEYLARVVVETASGRERADRPLRKGLPAIYPTNPGVIVVTVDPGHGGRFNNASGPGLLEKDANLDIGLKLQALLEQAGVQVVMTRTTDVAVNSPKSDVNGDGEMDRYDDDLERNDVANIARSDLNVHVHNNGAEGPTPYGTGTYIDNSRTFSAQARQLATFTQQGQVEALEAYRSAVFNGMTFSPRDRGVFGGWYYYMAPHDPPFLPRPTLMVGILTESLFLTNATDLEALKQPEVRLSIAAGMYVGVADWLNSRPYGAGYEALEAPPQAALREALGYRIVVTNRGNVTSSGWTLRLASVPAAPLYDGSGARGTQMGTARVPDGLAPGASVEVEVPAVAPDVAGEWWVKSDIVLDSGTYLSDLGVVSLQVPLRTTISP